MKENYKSSTPGKIEEHSTGLGVPSPEQVEERARELAVIGGRAMSEVNEEDRKEARRELLGETAPEEENDMVPTTLWDEAPGTTGHQTPDIAPEDEATLDETLVSDGVEEALHDEMLEARKKNIDAAS